MFEEYSDNLSELNLFPERKLFRISFDHTVRKFKLICKRADLFLEIQNAFSAPNPAAFFVSRYGYKTENKIYAINKFGYFSCGLIFEILKWIKLQFGSSDCVILSTKTKQYILDYITPLKTELIKNGLDNFKISNISEDLGRNNELKRQQKHAYDFRDYQLNAVEKLITKGYGRGLIEIPTAGGKSFILANFIWNLHKNFNSQYKYLILVPNKQLVVQFYKDLLDYGFDKSKVTQFTAGLKKNEKFNPESQIIVANRQYIFKNKNLLPKIDVLICDEVHQCLSTASREFIELLNCKIKIGCSGTIPRDKFQRWELIGMFSNIVYKEDITTLQEQGFISKLKITLLKITDNNVANNRNYLFHEHANVKYKPDEYGNSQIMFDDAYKAEHEYFAKYYKDLYQPVFKYLFTLQSNTLILFDRIEIGQNLYEYAKELYQNQKNVYYVDGSIDVNERERVRDEFEKQDGNLLIAQSATFATGINVKRLTNLVFLTSSKSFSRTIQSIGRTLRLHNSKTEAHLFDVSWVPFKYSQKHLSERLAIYKKMYNKSPDETLTFEIK